MNHYKSKSLAIALLIALLAGCDKPAVRDAAPPQKLPTMSLPIGRQTFELEVANTDQQREIGLMYRDSMAANHGMIFVFPTEQSLEFYMRNTRFALDIIYADSRGQIVSIRQMQPYDLTSIPSGRPAQFAIELNQGTAKTADVHVGDTLVIPADLAKSAR